MDLLSEETVTLDGNRLATILGFLTRTGRQGEAGHMRASRSFHQTISLSSQLLETQSTSSVG
jgi:hypothetical protein